MGKALGFSCTLVAALAVAAACTVHQSTDAPPLTGPSVLAHTLRVSADTNTMITISAFGPSGEPVPNVGIRLQMEAPNSSGALVVQDFGTLSTRTVQTDGNGITPAVVFTAPPAPPPASAGSGTNVTIVAIGTSAPFDTAQASTAIRLVPPGVILPPAGTPKAAFVLSPTPPSVNVPVNFDASASCAETDSSGTCTINGSIASFSWNFGDGATGSGRTLSHTFASASAFTVTLTVVNSRGVAASTSQSITATFSAGPSASFVFSPNDPVVGQAVVFDASASKAATGHSIVSYAWNFGDLGTAGGSVVTHPYATAGAFNVTLTVTDDTGQTAVSGASVKVGSPNPSAVLKTGGNGGNAIQADASGSFATGSATIASYRFIWGDGSADTVGAASSVSHDYALTTGPGPHTVTLIVTDSNGRTTTTSKDITTP